MALVVILVCCGLSAGFVGRIKGSSFFIWFLIGFCLPLVGTVAALLSRSEHSEPRLGCPHCGQTVAVYDQMCVHCGNDLDFARESLLET